ncbi:uncharacterized protein LOC126891890 [Diabrotica virgifera virgifera]|uniref:Transmembrane protein 70 homolog, mitochondrial n=1 Tax=Diabrotica virgifera virgifera TaxID=50390 RepID=A0ABM5L429_DIAVI|nr:uncharacterized protein LOC126891890 [Diabrotica virgifera virgifera]
MSIILVCRRVLNSYSRSNILNIVNGCKLHSNGSFLYKNNTSLISKRSFFNLFRKPTRDKLYVLDNVPDHFEIIHRNRMERYILVTRLGTWITSSIVFVFIILKYGSPKNHMEFIGSRTDVQRSSQNEFEIYLAMFTGLIVTLHLLIMKMPLRIYYSSPLKKYTMIVPSHLPFDNKRLSFTIGQLQKLPMTGILPWRDARYRIKYENDEKSLILMEDHFRKPADLWIMLGVQRDPNHEQE